MPPAAVTVIEVRADSCIAPPPAPGAPALHCVCPPGKYVAPPPEPPCSRVIAASPYPVPAAAPCTVEPPGEQPDEHVASPPAPPSPPKLPPPPPESPYVPM